MQSACASSYHLEENRLAAVKSDAGTDTAAPVEHGAPGRKRRRRSRAPPGQAIALGAIAVPAGIGIRPLTSVCKLRTFTPSKEATMACRCAARGPDAFLAAGCEHADRNHLGNTLIPILRATFTGDAGNVSVTTVSIGARSTTSFISAIETTGDHERHHGGHHTPIRSDCQRTRPRRRGHAVSPCRMIAPRSVSPRRKVGPRLRFPPQFDRRVSA